MRRRDFLIGALPAAALAAGARTPKFGHRQANMVTEAGPGVFDLARRIRGLSGVELQMHFQGASLWDADTLAGYRQAARKTGLAIHSLAGVWPAGGTIFDSAAEGTLRKSIAAAQALGSAVILVACFEKNCPIMDDEASYGPVVALLQKVSGAAGDAGVAIAMETSLSPASQRKLIDLVSSPAVGVYYDMDNGERYGHTGLAVPGIGVLGKRIRQVHLKNEARLLEEPGRVNWADALGALAKQGYGGWLVFESTHTGPDQCIDATQRNIAFATRCFKA